MHLTTRPIRILRFTCLWCGLVMISQVVGLRAQPSHELGQPAIENYSSKDYKGFPQVFGLTRDSRGLLYLTGNGITEFDGQSWRRVPSMNGITWSAVEATDGRVYIGGTDDLGVLQPDSLGQLQFRSLLHLVPERYRKFGQLRRIGTLGNAVFFASKTGYLLRYDAHLKQITVWSEAENFILLGAIDDQFYVQAPGRGLCVVRENDLVPVAGGAYFSSIPLVGVLPSAAEGMLVSTKHQGLFHYNRGQISPFPTEADALLRKWTFFARPLPDSTYAFSVIEEGLIILDQRGKWLRTINRENGLADAILLSIHIDATNDIWLGTNSGLSRVSLFSPVSKFTFDVDGDPLFIEDLARDNGLLYASSASTNGLLYLDPDRRSFCKVTNYPGGQAFNFSRIKHQLHGATQTGVYQLENAQSTAIFREYEDDFFTFCAEQSRLDEQLVFLGLQNGLAAAGKAGHRWSFRQYISAIPSNVAVKEIVETRPGTLWMATEGQGLWLLSYQPPKARNDSLLVERVRSVHQGSNQVPLGGTHLYRVDGQTVVTGAGGIYLLDEAAEQLTPDTRFPLPGPAASIQRVLLAEDRHAQVYAHFLLVDGSVVLGKYVPAPDGSYSFHTDPFRTIPENEILNVSKLFPEADGTIWIASQEGIFRVKDRRAENETVPEVLIRSVYAGTDSLLFYGHGPIEAPVLRYRENDITFHYLAPTLNAQNGALYQSKLEGFEEEWSGWSSKQERTFTNLPEGKYQFVVRSALGGPPFAEKIYSFEVLPPWWRSWWAYFLYTIGGITIVYGISQWRSAHLSRQREELRRTVRERTEEIERRLSELSAINKIQQALVAERNLERLYHTIGSFIRTAFKSDSTFIAILNSSNGAIDFPYRVGTTSLEEQESDAFCAKVLHGQLPLGLEMGVPIAVEQKIIGVIGLHRHRDRTPFDASDQQLLQTIASQVGLALHNAILFETAQQAKTDAEQASAAKSNFLSTVSHELRTPLTSIIGFAKIIKKRLEGRIFPHVQTDQPKVIRAIDQVSENLNIVVSEGDRLTTLINTVLDLAKIEAGRLDWDMREVQIEAIINQAVAATSALHTEKSLPLSVDVETGLPSITGDRDRLIQVVINLISNAVKFTNNGLITVRAAQEANLIRIEVQDSGIGIAEADLPLVFEKFKQVGDTLTDKPQGTGLGLPICKEIVEHHGGSIGVKSQLGLGSTFYFTLPVEASNHIQHHEPAKEPHKRTAPAYEELDAINRQDRKTIFIVDDEPEIRRLLRQEASDAGYRIQEAASGQEAIKMVRVNQPDLVILDVRMPEMDGFDVAAILKNDPATSHIPILIVSVIEDRKRISQLGIEGYFTKPINTDQLLQKIGHLLGRPVTTAV